MLFTQEYDNSLLLGFLCNELNFSRKRLDYVLTKYDSLNLAVADNFHEIDRDKNDWLKKFKIEKLEVGVQKLQEQLDSEDIKILTLFDDDYAKNLEHLPDQPLVLYYQGNAELLKLAEEEMITVVGSRKITKYTEILMDQILSKACLNGVGVVSGLAYGVDLLSHQIAVNNNAPTIGVLGGGLDRQSFYPKANLKLKKQIIDQGGLVMTEYAPGTEPNRYTFPKRNRILAALTPVTWVVQAQHKSGSLITANYAQDLNKTIAATPGSILENAYEGNIELIKNGANIITEPEDIMTLLGLSISLSSEAVEVQIDDSTQNQIHKVLTLKPQNIEEICAKTGFDHTATSTALSMLELSSYAKHMGENDWIRGK